MLSITITQNDDGKVDVTTDAGDGQPGAPETFETVDEALAKATDALKAGTVADGAPEGTPAEEGAESPAMESAEPPSEDAGMPMDDSADYQGMRPKKKPGWDKFMAGK